MKKMVSKRISILILLALLVAGGGAYVYIALYDHILDPMGVDRFDVEEIDGTHSTRLKISARLLFSGEVIRTITEKQDGPTITILVHLALVGLAKPKTTGGLEYEFSVPDSVNEVRFGRSSTLIWKRGASTVHF